MRRNGVNKIVPVAHVRYMRRAVHQNKILVHLIKCVFNAPNEIHLTRVEKAVAVRRTRAMRHV